MKLVICQPHRFELWNPPPWIAIRLHQEFPDVTAVLLPEYDRLQEEIANADVFVGLSLQAKQFTAARKLRWIHSPAAAVHQLMMPEVVSSKVLVTNAARVHGPVVAEHALALLLALAKRLPQAVRLQTSRSWGQQALWDGLPKPREVAGATACLIGMGSIGSEFAVRAKALGMRVLAVREHLEMGAGAADEVFSSPQIDDALRQADYIVIAAPLTPATRGLMNAQRLALMKKDACLINVSRGQVVDEEALIAALAAGTIGGAALDVFAVEPLPVASPLWDFENLLITPHSAALTEHLWERHYLFLAQNLRRFLAGEELLGMVEKTLGY